MLRKKGVSKPILEAVTRGTTKTTHKPKAAQRSRTPHISSVFFLSLSPL